MFCGRWNPAGVFGALHLTCDVRVAAANTRARFAHRAVKLFDLRAEARPQLVLVDVASVSVVDAVSADAIADLGFAASFPYEIPWPPCQAIASTAYDLGYAGVTSRSNAEVTATSYTGNELALFENRFEVSVLAREAFEGWYPDPIPG
jgi:RES domain-containing protein